MTTMTPSVVGAIVGDADGGNDVRGTSVDVEEEPAVVRGYPPLPDPLPSSSLSTVVVAAAVVLDAVVKLGKGPSPELPEVPDPWPLPSSSSDAVAVVATDVVLMLVENDGNGSSPLPSDCPLPPPAPFVVVAMLVTVVSGAEVVAVVGDIVVAHSPSV